MQLTTLEKRCLGPIPVVRGGFFYEPIDKVVRRLKAKGAPAKFIKEIVDQAKRDAEAFSNPIPASQIREAKLVSVEYIPPISNKKALELLLDAGIEINQDCASIGFLGNSKYMPEPFVIGPTGNKSLLQGGPVLSWSFNKNKDYKVVSGVLFPGAQRLLVYKPGTSPAMGYAFHMHTSRGRMPKGIKYEKHYITH